MIKLENLDGGHILLHKHDITSVVPYLVSEIKIAAQYRPIKSSGFSGSAHTTYERISDAVYESRVNGSVVNVYHSISSDRNSFLVKETTEEIQKLLK